MNAQPVAGSVDEVLIDTEVALGGFERRMAERELDLVDGGLAAVGQFGEGAAEVVRRNLEAQRLTISRAQW
ncbi:MAG TPA: hypothetical protein VFO57_01075 [Burkholderiales bacterium]|nr:hypothetical protein [Burkholderiales bacterium]